MSRRCRRHGIAFPYVDVASLRDSSDELACVVGWFHVSQTENGLHANLNVLIAEQVDVLEKEFRSGLIVWQNCDRISANSGRWVRQGLLQDRPNDTGGFHVQVQRDISKPVQCLKSMDRADVESDLIHRLIAKESQKWQQNLTTPARLAFNEQPLGV